MTDKTHHINETADKVVLKTKLKRGTGTRDEDKLDCKVKGESPEEVAQQMRDLIDACEALGLSDHLRDVQPGEGDE